MTLTLSKHIGQLFCAVFQLGSLVFSPFFRLALCIWGRNTTKVTHSSRSYSEARDVAVFVTGDVNFDLLLRVVSVMFLHCKANTFPFVISILWRDTLRLCKYSISHHICAH